MAQVNLVESLGEVVDNIKQFNEDIGNQKEVKEQLRQFKHWYYIPSLELFGPSKFIGYKAMTSEKYDRGRGKSGIDTQAVLKRWFSIVPADSNLYDELKEGLQDFLAAHGVKPRSNSVIHIPK